MFLEGEKSSCHLLIMVGLAKRHLGDVPRVREHPLSYRRSRAAVYEAWVEPAFFFVGVSFSSSCHFHHTLRIRPSLSNMAEMSDFGVVAEARQPSVVAVETAKGETTTAVDARSDTDSTATEPTLEEMKTLRRVSGRINWQMMTVTFVEFCERFSYYGTTAVFVNFIQQPRPFGSRSRVRVPKLVIAFWLVRVERPSQVRRWGCCAQPTRVVALPPA